MAIPPFPVGVVSGGITNDCSVVETGQRQACESVLPPAERRAFAGVAAMPAGKDALREAKRARTSRRRRYLRLKRELTQAAISSSSEEDEADRARERRKCQSSHTGSLHADARAGEAPGGRDRDRCLGEGTSQSQASRSSDRRLAFQHPIVCANGNGPCPNVPQNHTRTKTPRLACRPSTASSRRRVETDHEGKLTGSEGNPLGTMSPGYTFTRFLGRRPGIIAAVDG